ncbi:MAG: tRNA adenosine(34) deaminase TadA [Acholeplasmatales bacterium]|nr:tRNA adenosine(34) deaminase TadA [Acholeplasmatales bacterium]
MRFYSVERNDEYYMRQALKEALKADKIDEVPIGCVIVLNGKIIARGYNKREKLENSLAHAEIVAINKACKKINSWRLEDATMYITLEPCVMCSGAIIQSRIKKVIYGAYDYRFGAHKSIINLFDVKFNHQVDIKGGLLEEECSNLIKDFFKRLRVEKKNLL